MYNYAWVGAEWALDITLKNASRLQCQVRLGKAKGQNIAHKLSWYNLTYEFFGITQKASDDSYNLYHKCVLLLRDPFSPSALRNKVLEKL